MGCCVGSYLGLRPIWVPQCHAGEAAVPGVKGNEARDPMLRLERLGLIRQCGVRPTVGPNNTRLEPGTVTVMRTKAAYPRSDQEAKRVAGLRPTDSHACSGSRYKCIRYSVVNTTR